MQAWTSLRTLTRIEVKRMFRNIMPLVFNLFAPASLLLLFGLLFESTRAYLMPGMLTFMLLNANLTGVAHALVTQKEAGLLRHLFSTPLTPGVWLSSRLVAQLLLAAAQLALILVTGIVFLDVPPPRNLIGTLVALVFCTVAPLGLGLALGSLFHRVETAQPVVMLASLAAAFLGGAFLPLDAAPPFLQYVAKAVPSTYMVRSLSRVMLEGAGLASVAVDLAVLLAWTVASLGFGARHLQRHAAAR
ncbi:MAG: ABC transporter permease [Symbiobacterium sp.]|mgnify:CR=1 FL=1|uniref:ABC transporter permease n=1 Tax=Symbiobacterium sp. TaxID=1971213 RepID=UPI003463F76E